MDVTLSPARGRPDRAPNWLLWLLLFWVFSYAVLTLRAQVEFGPAFEWLHEKRAIGVTVGALLFGVALHLAHHARDARARAALLLASVLPASMVVLAARSAFDIYVLGTPAELTEDVNWTIVWAGYFGLALGVYLAVQHRSHAAARTRAAAAAPVASDYAWVVEVLADELAERRDAGRLIAELRARAGYMLADDADPRAARHNARVRLVERLAERIEDA